MTDTQREIRFRAWDDKNKEMIVWEKLIENHTKLVDLGINPKRFTFMQFTGLFDKNGKEIYEGDILRMLYTNWPSQLGKFPEMSHEEYLDSLSTLGVVEFSDDRFLVAFNKGFETGRIFEGKYGFKKIIGNIYENPELLNLNPVI